MENISLFFNVLTPKLSMPDDFIVSVSLSELAISCRAGAEKAFTTMSYHRAHCPHCNHGPYGIGAIQPDAVQTGFFVAQLRLPGKGGVEFRGEADGGGIFVARALAYGWMIWPISSLPAAARRFA
jgi:hypothetical protein